MQMRNLPEGGQLWQEGELALSIGVVESGKVGVRSGRRLIGVLFPKMVLGESAILGVGGTAGRRTASVYALEPSVIAEYPATMVKDAFGVGIPRLVLRTLCGQICRNTLLVMASHPDLPSVREPLMSLIQGVKSCEKHSRKIATWEEFLVVFRLLYHLREGSDGMLGDLFPGTSELTGIMVRASETIREIFRAPDLVEYLDQFLEAEKERRTLA
jgi:Cyclic nucleotide-binding domain